LEKRQREVEEQRQKQAEDRKRRDNFDMAAEDEYRKTTPAPSSRYDRRSDRREYTRRDRDGRKNAEDVEDEDAALTEKEKQAVRVCKFYLKTSKPLLNYIM
jgi:ATP-dependent RNA helicase DDX23/PRP28